MAVRFAAGSFQVPHLRVVLSDGNVAHCLGHCARGFRIRFSLSFFSVSITIMRLQFLMHTTRDMPKLIGNKSLSRLMNILERFSVAQSQMSLPLLSMDALMPPPSVLRDAAESTCWTDRGPEDFGRPLLRSRSCSAMLFNEARISDLRFSFETSARTTALTESFRAPCDVSPAFPSDLVQLLV